MCLYLMSCLYNVHLPIYVIFYILVLLYLYICEGDSVTVKTDATDKSAWLAVTQPVWLIPMSLGLLPGLIKG